MSNDKRKGFAKAIPPTPAIIRRIDMLRHELEKSEILLRTARELDAVEHPHTERESIEAQLCKQ